MGDDGPSSMSTKRRREKNALHDLPAMVCITAPTIGDATGMQIKVLPHSGMQPLRLELRVDIINYLSKVAVHQIENRVVVKNTKPKHQGSDDQEAGVSFESRRQAYRAKGPHGCKYFKVKDYADAKGEAVAWVRDSSVQETVPV